MKVSELTRSDAAAGHGPFHKGVNGHGGLVTCQGRTADHLVWSLPEGFHQPQSSWALKGGVSALPWGKGRVGTGGVDWHCAQVHYWSLAGRQRI